MQSIHCIFCPKHAVYTLHHLSLATKATACFVKTKLVKDVMHEGRRFA